MKLQMFQFIFISMAFHYGVEINGYKTTGNTERKSGCVVQAVRHSAQVTHTHTHSHRVGLNVLMLSRRHYIYRRVRI